MNTPRLLGIARSSASAETIKVKGQTDETLDVLVQRIWGPVFDSRDHAGRRRVAAWIAQLPEATNMTLVQLESVRDVPRRPRGRESCRRATAEFFVADERGANIGWTIMGRIPVRGSGIRGTPSDWSQPGVGWSGWLRTRIVIREFLNPEGGRIWTANARVVDGEALRLIGEGDLRARRARQADSR